MKGAVGIIIAIIVIALGIGAYFYFTGSPETVAYLNIESGNVQVNPGNGWQQATDQMELKKDYSVKTLDDSQASIVFYESDIMELSPNTEVQLAQLVADQVKINQKSGSTWNRVNKLTGTRDYEVDTPNSVATVRGTGFGVNVSGASDEIIVDEGIVECRPADGTGAQQIMEYQKCLVANGAATKGDVTKEQLLAMKNRIQNSIRVLKLMQVRELNKKKIIVGLLKKRYNLSDEDLRNYLEDVNEGKIDINELEKRVVVKAKTIEKIKGITLKIRKLYQRLDRIEQKIESM